MSADITRCTGLNNGKRFVRTRGDGSLRCPPETGENHFVVVVVVALAVFAVVGGDGAEFLVNITSTAHARRRRSQCPEWRWRWLAGNRGSRRTR